MSKTLPSLYYPAEITLWRLLFVVIPAWVLSVILIIILLGCMAIWLFSSWLWNSSRGISIYSHRGADK